VQLYHFEEARKATVAAERALQKVVTEQIRAEGRGERFGDSFRIDEAQGRLDHAAQRFNDRAEDVVATFRLIERCRLALARNSKTAKASQELLAVGGLGDIEVALSEVSSELLQLDLVCASIEVIPELEAGKAVLRRNQLLEAALALDGVPPVFFSLSDEDQLRLGNQFMTQLAQAANPANEVLGRRRVVQIIDTRECLSKHLGLNVKSLIAAAHSVRPIAIPA
jgi:hypothetical protein